MATSHLHDELADPTSQKVSIQTRYGKITGGTLRNGAIAFLEVPYALPPGRFEDPQPLNYAFRYEDKEYIKELCYAAQPTVDGQSAGVKFEDKVGYGTPSENPLFLNIILPPSYSSSTSSLPVRVYIHGGFLQFGSPHGISSHAQYIAAEMNQIWINIGYRLSVFGFLACDEPKVPGNFGFKDIWLALQWIRDNVHYFGGDSNNVQLSGLSAGAHAVHQVLHHVSRLPEGINSPFQSAMLQSNAILLNPKTPTELRHQFRLFCQRLGLDPDSPDILDTLRDRSRVTAQTITQLIDSGSLGEYDTFRGCLDGEWLQGDPMNWQQQGGFAHALKNKGVRSIILGDLKEEWYLYAIAWPINEPADVLRNVRRCFPPEFAQRLVSSFPPLEEETEENIFKLTGDVLAAAQVYLPVRLLHHDLWKAGFPVLRYDIRWAPMQCKEKGFVTHASDRAIWTLKLPILQDREAETVRAWLRTVADATVGMEENRPLQPIEQVLTLTEDQAVEWTKDIEYHNAIQKAHALLS